MVPLLTSDKSMSTGKLRIYFPQNHLTIHSIKMTLFSIKDFFSKCVSKSSFIRIWSHLLKKSFMENFIFCEVNTSKRLWWFCDPKNIFQNTTISRCTTKSSDENVDLDFLSLLKLKVKKGNILSMLKPVNSFKI